MKTEVCFATGKARNDPKYWFGLLVHGLVRFAGSDETVDLVVILNGA